MSNLIKIEYGTVQSRINITKSVISINNIYLNKTGVITIPKDDIYRSHLFSDPVKNQKKFSEKYKKQLKSDYSLRSDRQLLSSKDVAKLVI